MTTCVDIPRAREMRASGMTLEAVGAEFGVTRERIRQLVGSPPLRMTTCEGCGIRFEVRGVRRFCSPNCKKPTLCECGAAMSPTAARCLDCDFKARKADSDKRRSRIAEMWAEGASMRDVAQAVGTSVNALGGELVRMRRDGWDLPLRRAATPSPPVTKQQARDQLVQAVRNGQIRRPARCECCGRRRHVDGHHTDYSRALYVEWLCRSCHAASHAAEPDPFAELVQSLRPDLANESAAARLHPPPA